MKSFLYLFSFYLVSFRSVYAADTAKFTLPGTDPNFKPLED